MKIALSRRQFLWTTSAGVVVASLPLAAWRRWRVDEVRADSRPRYFTNPDDYATLEALVDRIIPPDTDPNTGMPSPGAKDAGVADYIDFLLGAFLSSRPFIFAGGPFSDRNPVDDEGLEDDMAEPIPLTPLQRLAWRIRILGTIAVASGNPHDAARIQIVRANNILAQVGDAKGDIPGFQDQYSDGITALRNAAHSNFGKDFPELTIAQQDMLIEKANQGLLGAAVQNFIGLVTDHAAEGMYGNPEYGGNQPPDRDRPATGADGDNRPIGWVIANFEGDRQPLGYTTFDPETQTAVEEPNHPVSTPDPGDPTFLDPKSAQMVEKLVARLRGLNNRSQR